MATIFVDRQANRPNRYKVIPDSGSAYYVTLERADEPTEAGTPLNADNLNKLLDKTGDTMTGPLNMAAGSFPTIYFTPNGGVGDSALEGGDRVISMHARDKIGVSTPRRQLAVYAAAARNNIADSVRLIDTAENGDKTYYYLYGEHHKPTATEIGAAAETHEHAASDITSGALAMGRGGTGSTNGATGLKNLLAAGNTVLSSYQYGTALPAAGTKGRLFFKKV